MRVCIVTLENTYPKRSGSSELLYNLSMGLVDLGFEIYTTSFTNRFQTEPISRLNQYFYHNYTKEIKPFYIKPFREFLLQFQVNGNAIRANLSPKFYQFLRSIFKKSKIDIVLIGTCWIAPISVLAAKSLSLPSVLYLNAIESDPQHGLSLPDRIVARFSEDLGIKFSMKTTVVSKNDENILLQRGVPKHKLELLPNVVDCRKYDELNAKDLKHTRDRLNLGENPIIVFVGGLDYPPNRLAVKRISEEIAPRVLREVPSAKFCIIGPHPPLEYSHPSIIYTGGKYGKELVPYIAMANVGIAPIEWGTGTRIKILEYFAAGLPVVSTSVGARGLEVVDGRDILIANNYEKFSGYIIELLRNEDLCKKLGSNAKHLVKINYCQEVVVRKLSRILETAIAQNKRT